MTRPNFTDDEGWSYEKQLAKELKDLIDAMADENETPLLHGARADTFEEVGMMTYQQGLVLRLTDGAEYQLTLVCSGNPDKDRCPTCMQLADDETGDCVNEDCAAYIDPKTDLNKLDRVDSRETDG